MMLKVRKSLDLLSNSNFTSKTSEKWAKYFSRAIRASFYRFLVNAPKMCEKNSF